ncbi:MAG: TfoX/Sxy family protein [Alphaproteobacteria bacterium]
MNTKDVSFKDFVLDQLQGLDDIEARRMFGGFGLYQEETFFAIVHKGRLYFKIDDATVGEYCKRNMKPFRPNPRQTLKTYYQAPAEILEDDDRLCDWAKKAVFAGGKIHSHNRRKRIMSDSTRIPKGAIG